MARLPKSWRVHVIRVSDDLALVTYDDSTGRAWHGQVRRDEDVSRFPAYVRAELADWWPTAGFAAEQETRS